MAAVALAAWLPLQAGAVEPRLSANGREVRSFEPPAVVSVPQDAQYLGGKRWVLYGYADCDLHLFVDKDAAGVVTRLYWIQSEGYIDSRPDLTHAGDYDASRKLELGGLDFHLDTWIRHRQDAAPEHSDLEQVERLIAEKKLSLPADMAFVRLVHLPDQAQRKELMIIYAERANGPTASPRQAEDAVANAKERIQVRGQ
ncbi:hypothetical protein M2650_01760 [Luteimonas sp. SX5]|uniref:Uncharacterized protein n=1 Tax=Luteimonas galliterrae TaxID=2940486 RepID=A0ABT0MFI6_9GAMM|nr:hypothetical protein [Luteimonas galliterrae]MCL1633373.1 hypothetical protein [Luteimonas galliterrae]